MWDIHSQTLLEPSRIGYHPFLEALEGCHHLSHSQSIYHWKQTIFTGIQGCFGFFIKETFCYGHALVLLATNWQNPRDFTSGRGIENCWVSSRGTDRLNKIRKLIQFCDVIMNKVLIDKTLPPVNTFEQSSQVYQKWSALLKKMLYPQWPNNKRKLWTIPPIHFLLEQLSKQKLSQHRRNSHSASIPLCELAAGDLCLLLIKFMVVI